jgi:hypothetical protein
MATDPLLATLERLDREATPGPWAWESVAEKDTEWCMGAITDAEGNQLSGFVEEPFDPETGEYGPQHLVIEPVAQSLSSATFGDATLISSLRNALPELVRFVEAAEGSVNRWSERYPKYREARAALAKALEDT